MADSPQETQLLQSLKDYELGLIANIQQAQANKGLLDPVSQSVLANVASSIPGAAQAQQLANTVYAGVVKATGVGSLPSRLVAAAFSGNIISAPINEIKAVFNGRTYNSDQYTGAAKYYYYVAGHNVGSTNNLSDSDVIPALKWFIDKTGVFISGQAHIDALRHSASAYIALVNVNSYTTTDVNRVMAAVAVVQQYMPDNSILGYWAGTVGVYDAELIQLANEGYSNYSQNLQAVKQSASNTPNPVTQVSQAYSSPNILLVLLVIYIIIILIIAYVRPSSTR